MTQTAHPGGEALHSSHTGLIAGDPAYQAFRILQIGFVVLPIIAGADKFFGLLVNWDNYFAERFLSLVGGHKRGFMMAVGVIEIIAGLGVAVKPKIFAYVVAGWLLCLIVNLLFRAAGGPSNGMTFYDIALRDVGLMVAALALARLSHVFDHAGPRRA